MTDLTCNVTNMIFSSVPGTLKRDQVSSTTEGPAPAMPAHACLTHPTLNKGAGSGPWINGLCIKKLGATLYREQRQIHCHIEQYSPQQPIVAWNHLMRQHRGYTVPHCNTEQYPPFPRTIVAWNHLLRQHSPLRQHWVLQVGHCLGQAPISSSATTAFWSSQPVAPDFWMSNDVFSKNSYTRQTTKDFISCRDSDSRHVGFSRILMK